MWQHMQRHLVVGKRANETKTKTKWFMGDNSLFSQTFLNYVKNTVYIINYFNYNHLTDFFFYI